MSSVSLETNPGSCKRKHGSNFNSSNDNKLAVLLAKNNIITIYVHAMFLT